MTIQEVYKKLITPPNLQHHMMLVAHVGSFICDNWIGKETIDKNIVVRTALLHDIGNTVRFNFDDKNATMLGEEEVRIDYWKDLQRKLIEKYGDDDHFATQKMLTEIGIDKYIISTILDKSFSNAIKTDKEGSWNLKILAYSDMRVIPSGITSLDGRIKDSFERLEKYRNRPDIQDLITAIKRIELDIQKIVNQSLDKVPIEMTEREADYYLQFEL